MIQKLQTYLIRFINWLEDNSEVRFIHSVLSSNEDIELNRLYKEINYLKARSIDLGDKLSKNNQIIESAINSAYSHIKRKHKFLKMPYNELQEGINSELSAYSTQDAILVATRLQKILELARSKPEKVRYETVASDSDTLARIVLYLYQDIPTIESSLRKIEEVK